MFLAEPVAAIYFTSGQPLCFLGFFCLLFRLALGEGDLVVQGGGAAAGYVLLFFLAAGWATVDGIVDDIARQGLANPIWNQSFHFNRCNVIKEARSLHISLILKLLLFLMQRHENLDIKK